MKQQTRLFPTTPRSTSAASQNPDDATDFNCETDRYPYHVSVRAVGFLIVLSVLAWALIVLGCAYVIHAIRTRPIPPHACAGTHADRPQHNPAPFSARMPERVHSQSGVPIAILLCALAVSCASPNTSPDYPLRTIRDPVTEELPDVQFAP